MLEVAVGTRLGAFELEAALRVPAGSVLGLLGRSGSGKTTLINIIAGLLRPARGLVQLEGRTLTDIARGVDVPPEGRRIGYVFQDSRLFPHLRVADNLRYGAKRARAATPLIGYEETVALLALAPLLARRPHELSGGERQRVALGRALLAQPRLLLLDEPLAAIDAAHREELLPYLESLRERLAIPVVYVSHQLDEVLRLASELALLEGGRVLAQGAVAEVSLRPEMQRVVPAECIGAVLDGTIERRSGAEAQLRIGAGTLQVSAPAAPVGTRLRLQVLARDVILATEPVRGLSVRNALPGTVTGIRREPQGVLVEVDVGGARVLSRITVQALEALALTPGLPVWALFKAVSTSGHAYRLPAAVSSAAPAR